MKKIDMFCHFFPKTYFDRYIASTSVKDSGKRVARITRLRDLDERFRMMDRFGDYSQVISLSAPTLELMAPPDKSPELAQVANDGMAELVQKYPDRFPGFVASLALNNVDAAMKEMDRAMNQLGAKGVQIFTNIAGKPIDLPEFQPLFDEIGRRDIIIWLHPARAANFPDYLEEKRSKYEIWWTFGWPYETSAAMARIVFSKWFDRFPDLKVITHHLGAMVPYFDGRVGPGWDQLGTRTSDEDYVSLLHSLKKRPIEYFRQFYADTALNGSLAGTRCGLEFFPIDRVLYASDDPFDPEPGMYIKENIKVLEQLNLPAADLEKIFHGNAERLLSGKAKPAKA